MSRQLLPIGLKLHHPRLPHVIHNHSIAYSRLATIQITNPALLGAYALSPLLRPFPPVRITDKDKYCAPKRYSQLPDARETDSHSLPWGRDEYQRVSNRGIWHKKSNSSRQGNRKIPATDPCLSPPDIRHDPMKDCIAYRPKPEHRISAACNSILLHTC